MTNIVLASYILNFVAACSHEFDPMVISFSPVFIVRPLMSSFLNIFI